MGMFDSVFANCPNCGEEIEFQSKSGPCLINRYKASSVPVSVASGCNGDVEECICGAKVTLKANTERIAMTVEIVRNENEQGEYD